MTGWRPRLTARTPFPPPRIAGGRGCWSSRALQGKALAVQWAIVAVFFDRVLRARLTGPAADDSDVLDHAAEVLTAVLNNCCRTSARKRSRPRRTTSCEGSCV